jgi:hypothetical protein
LYHNRIINVFRGRLQPPLRPHQKGHPGLSASAYEILKGCLDMHHHHHDYQEQAQNPDGSVMIISQL